MYSVLVLLLSFSSYSAAVPAPDGLSFDTNPVGLPFVNAILPVQPGFSSRFSLFRRQGCPNLTLLCPSGVCCSDDSSCCGNTCCPSGYLCTGSTGTAPCCVAMGSETNTCGGTNSNNPCSRPGDVQCEGINICCPPSNLCYYDSSNVARCSPLSPSVPPSPSTTTSISFSTTTPAPELITTSATTSYSYVTTSSQSPSPTPFRHTSSSSTFWTPAAIGGVTGGSIGGVILFAVVIWCCCRRRTKRPQPEPDLRPLSGSEIYWLIKDLDTTQKWQDAYTSEAKRMSSGVHIDQVSWMEDFSTRAVKIRTQQLRDGGERSESRLKAGLIGAIPLVKYWGWFRNSTKKFNRVAIDTLGMGDSADMASLYKDAKKAANQSSILARLTPAAEWIGKHEFKQWWDESDLAAQVQQEMAAYVARELGQDAATDLMTELVHLKPGFGQVISGGRAAWKCDQKMLKALTWLESVAAEFHVKMFVVNALAEVFPAKFGIRGEGFSGENYVMGEKSHFITVATEAVAR